MRRPVEYLNQRQHERDERGYRVHLAFGLFFCVMLAAPISPLEFAFIPVVTMWLLRIWCLWRLSLYVFVQPLVWALFAWAAYQAISLTWTPDLHQGLREMGDLRWSWTLLALFPLLDRRRWLIWVIAAGFLVGNGAQFLNAIGEWTGAQVLTFGNKPLRIAGWWAPVVAGSLLTGALGLHLPAALMGKGRVRIVAAICAAITLVGILATGTRGAWIGAAMLVALAIGVAYVRAPRVRAQTVLIGCALACIVVLAGWLVLGDSIQRRVESGWREITGALYHDRFNTDTGARLLMWWWAAEAFAEKPITGVGVGGYPAWVTQHLIEQDIDPDSRRVYAHAHGVIPEIAATGGLIGLVIGAFVLGAGLRGAAIGLNKQTLGTYDAGPLFAIAGLMFAGIFDPIHLNAQTAALFITLLALCQWPRPPDRADTL